MTAPLSLPSKSPYLLRAMHQWMVDNDLTPYVKVFNRAAGVKGPPQEMAKESSIYNIAPQAVINLVLGNALVTFGARFNGQHYDVTLPISAIEMIYARENGEGMMFAAELHSGTEVMGEPGETLDERGIAAADPVPPIPESKKERPSFMKLVK